MRNRKQAPFAQNGNAGGGTIIYREQVITALGNSIQNLEAETGIQRQMLTTLTQGGTIGRGGTAGGVRMLREQPLRVGTAGGANAEGGVSNPVWIAQLLGQHGEGLTAAQIREYAVQAGRTVHASFPHDSFGKMRAKGEVRKSGSGANARYRLTQKGIGRMEKAGTANLPAVGRQKRGPGKAMTATA